jgi:hypothetical protein
MAAGEYEPNRRIGWEPEAGRVDTGNIWVDGMYRTLERLDGLCSRRH